MCPCVWLSVCPKYSELYILMACNGVLTPLPTKLTSNLLFPPSTRNKQDVKLMHKPLIQHNCQQQKKLFEEVRQFYLSLKKSLQDTKIAKYFGV